MTPEKRANAIADLFPWMATNERQQLVLAVTSAIKRGAAQELNGAWRDIDELYANEPRANSSSVFKAMAYELSFDKIEKRIAALGFNPPKHDYTCK